MPLDRVVVWWAQRRPVFPGLGSWLSTHHLQESTQLSTCDASLFTLSKPQLQASAQSSIQYSPSVARPACSCRLDQLQGRCTMAGCSLFGVPASRRRLSPLWQPSQRPRMQERLEQPPVQACVCGGAGITAACETKRLQLSPPLSTASRFPPEQ